jgi:hypothetical protein
MKKRSVHDGYTITDTAAVNPGEEYVLGVKDWHGFLQYAVYKRVGGSFYIQAHYYLNRTDAVRDMNSRAEYAKQAYANRYTKEANAIWR